MRKSLKQPVPANRSPSVASRVAIKQHPLHPILVVYPVAALTLLPLADVLYLLLEDPFWARAAWWLNVLGLGGGLFAAVFGILDMFLIRVVRRHVSAWIHFIAGVMLLALAAAGVSLRLPDPEAAIWPWGLLLSGVGMVMVVIVGWLGGALTFRHGIGVYGYKAAEDAGEDAPPGP